MLPMIRVSDLPGGLGSAPSLPFGPPSVARLQSQLAEIRGQRQPPPTLQAIEQIGGVVAGAIAVGASRQSVSDPLLALLAIAVGGYGTVTGQSFLASVGIGALAPLVAEWSERNLRNSRSPDNNNNQRGDAAPMPRAD